MSINRWVWAENKSSFKIACAISDKLNNVVKVYGLSGVMSNYVTSNDYVTNTNYVKVQYRGSGGNERSNTFGVLDFRMVWSGVGYDFFKKNQQNQ